MKLVLCYTTDKARVWARWNHSFDVHLSALGPVSCLFPHPESPRGALVRRLGSWQPVCLHPEFPQGSLWGWLLWLDGWDILCLLIRQATFFPLTYRYAVGVRNHCAIFIKRFFGCSCSPRGISAAQMNGQREVTSSMSELAIPLWDHLPQYME